MEAVEKFCESLQHIMMAVSWGGHESLVIPKCVGIQPEDFDPTDIFLNKIYAFVRRFTRNVPWLRENFLTNRAIPSSMGLDTFNDGVFSDVVVEVRKISSYAPYQDLKLVQNNHELIKGRLFF